MLFIHTYHYRSYSYVINDKHYYCQQSAFSVRNYLKHGVVHSSIHCECDCSFNILVSKLVHNPLRLNLPTVFDSNRDSMDLDLPSTENCYEGTFDGAAVLRTEDHGKLWTGGMVQTLPQARKSTKPKKPLVNPTGH